VYLPKALWRPTIHYKAAHPRARVIMTVAKGGKSERSQVVVKARLERATFGLWFRRRSLISHTLSSKLAK
jgi:hypothetical protein